MARTVTFKGKPLDLVGPELKAGDAAPDFTAVAAGLEVVTLAKTPAKTRLFSIVPSLDTGICAIQTKKFNEKLAELGDKVVSYTVSLDMPFAQKRFCDAEKITNLTNLSDLADGSFGKNYGVLAKGLPIGLLARSIVIVDKNNKIAYVQIVPEIAQEPDYDAVLAALKAAA